MENSRAHLNNLFFDPRRYDLARFGRYKMNNKLSLTRRIAGYKAAEDIIAPLTGELLAAKGEKINMAKAEEIDNAGVTRVTILVEKKGEEPRPFIVISNGCVNAQNFFSFDVEAEAGVNERANFAEIRKILDTTSDVEEQKELLRQNHDVLISRTVTVDDIFPPSTTCWALITASVPPMRSTIWATAASAASVSCCRTSSASASPAWSASSVSA